MPVEVTQGHTRLTKSAILNGKEQVHVEYIEEFDGEIEFRSLTAGQNSQVEAIRASGAKMSGKPIMNQAGDVDRIATSQNLSFEIDLKEASVADFEADVLAVAYSISSRGGDTWTVDEVKSIRPPEVISKLAAIVYRISQVTPNQIEQVRNFRGKRGGSVDSDDAPDGDTTG